MRTRMLSLALMVLIGLSACALERPTSVVVAAPGRQTGGETTPRPPHHPHAGMIRYPDVSATHIVFVYANDLWLVPREGGLAQPLASPPGQESFPRFGPDGRTIAFVGNYEGNHDLYTIPASGGLATRVTYHPARETLCDWTPKGRLLFFSNALAPLRRRTELLAVSASGGLPTKLPVPYGANGAISPDGTWLAYTPHTRDHRTWKRYRGGMATDIWLFNLRDHTSKKITDWVGTDSQPMWHGKTVYYLSDAGAHHRLNIWAYDTAAKQRKQITDFSDFDVKWPAIGPGSHGEGEIVFQHGFELVLLNLDTRQARAVEVMIPGDQHTVRPRAVDASKFITNLEISSTGKRAAVEVRGDIWTLPAKKGSPRNLTRTSGVAERDPAWSPDGRWIAYFSDKTGEYELYIQQSDGLGETKQLTHDGHAYRYSPTWSPDSKQIAFSDKSGAMFVYTIASGQTTHFDTEPWASPSRMNWSHDSRWLAYTKGGDNQMSSIWLYDVSQNEKHQVTNGMFEDSLPTFDRKGDYLFFASHRSFTRPLYEDVGTTFVYAGTDRLLVVPLRDEVGSPWAPTSDDETWEGKEKADDHEEDASKEKADEGGGSEKKDQENHKEKRADSAGKDTDHEPGEKDKKEEEIKPLVLTLEDFEQRALPLPVKKGSFTNLAVNHEGKLIYTRRPPRGGDGKPSIKIFDLTDEDKKEKTVLEDAGTFVMSADGKKLLVRKGKTMAIVDAAADQKWDKPISLEGMTVVIDPRSEWRQMFHETWRVERDFFYDPHMHGVDWDAMRKHYEPMVEDCASREDLRFVIGELISELNVGHAYARGGGDLEKEPEVSVGMLGVDFQLDQGAYRIARILAGGPWDVDARGPLSKPGVDVHEGDYLLAVNGVPLDTKKDPWAAFAGLAKRTVTITVSSEPALSDKAREVVVELLGSEANLRYRHWIEHNRAYVDGQSNGRVGYIYVPNTGLAGQNDLFRQFYGQRDKAALIIDERWNGGGQIPTRFIELLHRPIANYWARRDGHDWPWPPDAQQGPKCMLINGLAGSGGDYFPFYFRKTGLGKLIGMRTWGGLVGFSGNPILIDGGRITAPTFAFYETDGTWGIEGYGVAPDIEVIDDPALMTEGGDPQLDAAIGQMLSELKKNPYTPPQRPAYPDRSGMGIREEDK